MSEENVYDKAHELARTIRSSEEWKALAKTWEDVDKNPEHRRYIEQFRELSMELQALQMQGKDPSQEKGEEWNRLLQKIQSDSTLSKYLESERRFGQLMADINRIVSGPVEELYKNSRGK
ncbi:YlbF family regulator [Melghirimyces algeriensis]|uniref:UPF0342 protein SAMN06264849_10187 n=1 Tax=Melghirimyces algeriensis TaxID=910412 RepID=A0A521AE26_9BACL|nr:YlbF family regulator [Melghirimyces algeriensis]SMO33026.1 Cell fate regulator YlbF, YheA/YmcA/DUF963 family (controls sporulation, competence, biofilm development) [Melghirimyces algeriensis]